MSVKISYFVHGITTDNIEHKAPQLTLEVITKNTSWKEAIERDWRKNKKLATWLEI